MGGEQAAKVMDIVNRAKLQRDGPAGQRRGAGGDERRAAPPARRRVHALFGTARLWDDGIIDPRDTRRCWACAWPSAAEAEARTLRPNTFGVARL
jgi:geranyl-CoA carboxylase beta subunit